MEFIISFAIVAVLVAVVFLVISRQNKQLAAVVAGLTEEQAKRLGAAEVSYVEGRENCWQQEGMIVSVKDKGSVCALYVIYCNKTIRNAGYGGFASADIKMKKDDFEARELAAGSFVNICVDAEKCEAVIL